MAEFLKAQKGAAKAFLMVFLLQHTQARDDAAIQVKLDELIRVSAASDQFIGIDKLPRGVVEAFGERCAQAAAEQSSA